MFAGFGVEPDTFVARFTEGLELMKTLWTQPDVKFAGRFWQLDGAAMEPKPFQKPYPPLWFGGNAPAALRRAVQHGDGFIGAGSQTTAAFAAQVPVVREALKEQGRTDFRIAKRVYLAVDDDAARARERLSAALHRLYSFFGISDLTPVTVSGPPDACVEGLRAVADAGAEMILLNPLFDEAEQLVSLPRSAV
jgi:alkanesulfonate monooxygenase SsuD/methylene tetrahydromethanopterin reductase-like flavin-dependent oxidoreductase (luciferase family)